MVTICDEARPLIHDETINLSMSHDRITGGIFSWLLITVGQASSYALHLVENGGRKWMNRTKLLLLLFGVIGYGALLISETFGASAIRSFYIAVPVLLAFAISSFQRSTVEGSLGHLESGIAHSMRNRFWFLVGCFSTVELLSVSLLKLSGTRNGSYYLLVFISLVLIGFQILSIQNKRGTRFIVILLEIGASLALIVCGKFLAYEQFFGGMDSIYHSAYVQMITNTGHIQPQMGNYYYFPLEHTIGSIVQMTASVSSGLGSLYALFGAASLFIPATIAVVLRRFGFNPKTTLFATVLVSHGALSIFFLTEVMPQGLLFFFTMPLLFCLLCKPRTLPFLACFVVLSLAALFTHHVMIPVMIAGLAIASMTYTSLKTNKSRYSIGFSPIAFLIVIYVAYMILVSISTYGIFILRPELANPASISDASRSIGYPTIQLLTVSLVRNLGVSISIFLIGMFLIRLSFGSIDRKRGLRAGIVAMMTTSSILYYPNPLSLSAVANSFFALWRFTLFVEPVIMITAALELSRHFKEESSRRKVMIAFVVAIIAFSSITNSRNDSDRPWFGSERLRASATFAQSDVMLMDLVERTSAGSTILADAPVASTITVAAKEIGVSFVAQLNNTLHIPSDSYVIIRSEEFSFRGGIIDLPNNIGGTGTAVSAIVTSFDQIKEESCVLADNGRSCYALTITQFTIPFILK